MPRKPKPKNSLSAGERVALYKAEQEEKIKRFSEEEQQNGMPKAQKEPEGSTGYEQQQEVKLSRPPKKELSKPQHALVKVDFSLPIGEIRPMHGMCNGPVSYGADITDLFKEIGVPYVRFDCTDTPMSGYAVDISRIFKNIDADPSLEESYDFEFTDRYVEAALKCGAGIVFRLGESRDALGYAKKVAMPRDIDVISRVCVEIVKHYRGLFADGFDASIRLFEIWSHDPDATEKERVAEFELFRRVANAIKTYDGSIKVGGMCFDGFDSSARDFVRYCKRNRVPFDFLSMDIYSSDPEKAAYESEQAIKYIRNLGYDSAFIMVGKWSYIDADVCGDDWRRMVSKKGELSRNAVREMFEAQSSVKGAAYCAAFMLRMSEVEGVDMSFFYDAQPMVSPWCAIADRFGSPSKAYYSFKSFGELYRARTRVYSVSEQQEGYLHNGIYVGAALSDKGGYVMLSSFGGCAVVDLRLDGIPENLYTADIYMLDGVKNMSLGDSVPLSGIKKRLLLSVSEYGVIVIKLY